MRGSSNIALRDFPVNEPEQPRLVSGYTFDPATIGGVPIDSSLAFNCVFTASLYFLGCRKYFDGVLAL